MRFHYYSLSMCSCCYSLPPSLPHFTFPNNLYNSLIMFEPGSPDCPESPQESISEHSTCSACSLSFSDSIAETETDKYFPKDKQPRDSWVWLHASKVYFFLFFLAGIYSQL